MLLLCNELRADLNRVAIDLFFFLSFRVIESFVNENSDQLSATCLDNVIELCVSEMTKSSEHTPEIQNPSLAILVAAGRYHCSKVMEGLLKQLPGGQVGHFMVLHCIGSLATANTCGMIQFIRPTLETIIPTLSAIKMDHLKQAYSFGEFPYQIEFFSFTNFSSSPIFQLSHFFVSLLY